MRTRDLTIHVVDDDASVRDSLALLLGLSGYRTACFADAESFLASVAADSTGCCIVDLRLPAMSGLELQEELHRRGVGLPVIVITAHGDVPAARAAFRAQAIDFLEKPFAPEALLAAVGQALDAEGRRADREAARSLDASRLQSLTQREREVLERVAQGLHAKEIASTLGISPRTVEVHKSRIMAKLDARNAVELARLALGLER